MCITRAMQYQTTGIRNLDWKLYTKSILPKPPKPEQTAIATLLSKVGEAIAATQNSIKAADKLKKSLMQNLLTGKLKPDGSWRKEDEFYEDEKFGKVPLGWILGKVKKVIKLKNGKGNTTSNLESEPDSEYNIPVFGGNGITGYYHTPLLTEPTLIIGRVGEYCGNVFLTPEKSWVTDNAMLVEKFLIEDYSLEFFKYKFNTLNFIYYSDTTGQPKLTQGSIGSISFIYPESKIEQTEIADKINSVELKITEKQTKIQTLQRLKKSLMQNLLTGKVRLPQEFIAQFEEAVEEVNKKTVTVQ
jgi:type I restriction enzyme S subunit